MSNNARIQMCVQSCHVSSFSTFRCVFEQSRQASLQNSERECVCEWTRKCVCSLRCYLQDVCVCVCVRARACVCVCVCVCVCACVNRLVLKVKGRMFNILTVTTTMTIIRCLDISHSIMNILQKQRPYSIVTILYLPS